MLNLALAVLLAAPAPDDAKKDAYLDAIRKGDAAAVKALLDQGVEVDARFRYDRTALSFAADRGNLEIVTMILERGADVNAKDTFYGVTPLTWALEKEHVEIARLLLEKGATGGEDALETGVEKGNAALVALALDKVKPTPDELSVALASAEKDGKKEIAEQLKKAGAQPLPPADYEMPASVLAKYAGGYRAESGRELKLEVQGGALTCMTCGPKPQRLDAVDGVTFRPEGEPAPTVIVRFEGMKVVGLRVRNGRQETLYNRVEEKR
jgi:hypothetical protein